MNPKIVSDSSRRSQVLILGLICCFISVVLLLYKSPQPRPVILKQTQPSIISPSPEDSELTPIQISGPVDAVVQVIPRSQWAIYKNNTYHFLFQFPKSWNLGEPFNDGPSRMMGVAPLPPKNIGGGYNFGIYADEIYENKEKLSLDEFTKRLDAQYIKYGGDAGNYKLVPVKTNVKAILVDRNVPGAVEGQLLLIQDKEMKIFKIYCPSCSDEVVNKVADTFQTFN